MPWKPVRWPRGAAPTRQASDEVKRLEQHMGGAVAQGLRQLVDHQAIAGAAKTIEGDGWARDVAA
jgi:hypothetical protein